MKYLFLIFILFGVLSCAESRMLQKSLNEFEAPVEYLYDSMISGCQKNKTIWLYKITNPVFDSITAVSQLNHKVHPFLIYNYEEITLSVRLGQTSLQQDYNGFFRRALITESGRSGCYNLDTSSQMETYSLEINIDTCLTKSLYQKKSTLIILGFGFSMNSRELGSPSETKLSVKVTLKKLNNIVFEKNYSVYRIQPFINTQVKDTEKFRSTYVANMVESLSLSTKECIETIVNDINMEIEKN